MVFFGITPHRLASAEPGNLFNWITIPLSWFLQWKLPDPFTRAVLRGETIVGDETVCLHLDADTMAFQRWHDDLRSAAPQLHRAAMLEIQARIERLEHVWSKRAPANGHAAQNMPLSSSEASYEKVEHMLRFIASNYAREIQATDIAAAAGIRTSHAAAVFRQLIGMTPLDFLTRQRVVHARRLLSTTSMKVRDVALASGFGSLTRFYDVFSKSTGLSPRQLRDESLATTVTDGPLS